MVLDGVMDPADPLPQLADAQAGGFEGAFDAMADWCDTADDCYVDDPLAAYDELAARVEDDPLPSGDGREVGPAELAVGTETGLYSPHTWSDLSYALATGLDGDGEIIQAFVDSYYGSASFTSYAAVVCLDFGPPDEAGFDDLAESLDESHPRFGWSLGYELLPCAYWPTPPARTPAPVTSPEGSPPVLSITSTGDPATPPAEAEDVAARLDGELLRLDAVGHVAIHESDCVDQYIEAYFLDLSLPPEGELCS
jgi:pimeloyl-ACP methyl ester carboxylesterase